MAHLKTETLYVNVFAFYDMFRPLYSAFIGYKWKIVLWKWPLVHYQHDKIHWV